ncbi:MAG TPA: NADAR family protein [Candidatus Solibacter sp.]|nr:NADAR family protein [Candidatus Solibacter sp.]
MIFVALLLFAGGLFAQRYPPHWWTPAPEAGKPAWEILPQAARPGEVILSKRNELGILSNFAATPFTYRGKRYASVEGFWQMMLYPEGASDPRRAPGVEWPHTRDEVAAMTAFEAKAAGDAAEANMRKLGIDWVTFEEERMPYRSQLKGEHYRLIVGAMWAKLVQNPKVRQTLLATGHLTLRPDHIQEPDAPPEWRYFEIWMELRAELQRATSSHAKQ